MSCNDYNKLCWVDPADNKHYGFDTKDTARWVKAINAEFATVEHPSENLRGHLVRKNGDKSKVKQAV